MNETKLATLEQVRIFLAGTAEVGFCVANAGGDERYRQAFQNTWRSIRAGDRHKPGVAWWIVVRRRRFLPRGDPRQPPPVVHEPLQWVPGGQGPVKGAGLC